MPIAIGNYVQSSSEIMFKALLFLTNGLFLMNTNQIKVENLLMAINIGL